LVAFTVKPRIGLTPGEFAKVCVEVGKGGIDIVEDDERLSNQSHNDLLQRAESTIKALKAAKVNTVYSANITGRSDQIVQVADSLIDLGVRMLKIDVLPAGFGALQAVSEYLHRTNKNVGITVFPAMNAVYDRIGRGLILTLSRLCGADVIYAGIPPFNNVTRVQDPVRFATAVSHHRLLKSPKPFQKTVLPTVSTGISPMNIGAYTQLLGSNVGFFVGGGIAANPMGLQRGTEAVIRALQQVAKDDSHSIFTTDENKQFAEVFGNFVTYKEQPEPVKRAALSIRDI
jgi:ribulose 1,5-bisphosphate carboxylase large subunit-like protein